MLTLVTGVPGAGKTLNTIKMVLELQEESKKKGDPRRVFYFNIKGLRIPDWTELTESEVKLWMDCPAGSIIVIDEAQAVFPQRGPKNDQPPHVEALNTHRHHGFDFYIVTQYPKMLDVAVRRLTGRHLHFDRRFGAQTVNRYEWNRVEEDPNDKWKKQEAVRESVKFDKSLFGLYESAEVHTHKRRYPKKVIAAVVFFLAIPFAMYFGISNLNLPDGVALESAAPLGESGSPVPSGAAPGGTFSRQVEAQRLLDRHRPRVAGLPHTAPIYDELTTPVTYPKYNCMMPHDAPNECRCYSQQATLLDTTIAVCLSIIERGLFDPARPDAEHDRFVWPAGDASADYRAAPAGVSDGRIITLRDTSAQGRSVQSARQRTRRART
jgi:zona occludens toxin